MVSNHFSGRSSKLPALNVFAPQMLLWIVDACFIGILIFAPLFMGGRHPVGRLVYVSIASVMAAAWLTRQCLLKRAIWRSTAGQWLFLAACFLVLFQVFPLTQEWISVLTPSSNDILSLWNESGESGMNWGHWPYISLNPQSTKAGLAILFAYGITFLVTVQRAETLQDVQKMLQWIAFSSVALALLGLAQFFFKDQILWWVQDPSIKKANGLRGCFTNPNHFSHLLSLGLGSCAGWLLIKIRQPIAGKISEGWNNTSKYPNFITLVIGCLGVGIVAFTGVFAMSRGGMLAMLVATITFTVACRKVLDRQILVYLLGGIALGGCLLAVHGFDDLVREIDTVKELSFQQADYKQMRTAIWGANIKAIETRPWFGHGVGTHQDFYKTYLEIPFPVLFTHAESGYLQIASESGFIGLALLFLAFLICGFWCVQAVRKNHDEVQVICIASVVAALGASAVQSIVDFVWYIPACMSWTMILCGIGCRLYQMRRTSDAECNVSLPKIVWIGITVIVVVLNIGIVNFLMSPAQASGHWDNYVKYARKRHRVGLQLNSFKPNEIDDNEIFRIAEGLDTILEQEIRAYLSKDLNNATAHLRMAAIYLRQFQTQQRSNINPMDIGQIRDAAIASQFPSKEALSEWLGRAIGEHQELLYRALWHAREAVMRCPLQGEAYLFLAELVFLEGKNESAKRALVEQATRVRPFDGKVLLMAGKESAVAGEVEEAVAHWKKSFQCSVDGKLDLLRLLSQRIPANIVIQMLEPSAGDLPEFYQAYRILGDQQQIEFVNKHFESMLWREKIEESRATGLWITLTQAYRDIEKNEDALRCVKQAIHCDAGNFDSRLLMASILFELRQFENAEQELRWFIARRPEHSKAQKLLKMIVKARIAGQRLPNGTKIR